MVKQNDDFLMGVSERIGKSIGDLYATWHNIYSTELSYKWLEENNYEIEVILYHKYQRDLSLYLVEQFIKWYKDTSNEG